MIPERDYTGLRYDGIDGADLDNLLSGMEITGAEPIDYPLTDGVVLYLRGKRGKMIIEVFTPCTDSIAAAPILIEAAAVPPDDTTGGKAD